MPTFNGQNIFGTACVVLSEPMPAAIQMRSYPGVRGWEKLSLGDRGITHKVTGQLVGNTTYDLGSAMLVIFPLVVASISGVFFDDLHGLNWPNTFIQSFRFTEPAAPTPGWGYTQGYEAALMTILSPF